MGRVVAQLDSAKRKINTHTHTFLAYCCSMGRGNSNSTKSLTSATARGGLSSEPAAISTFDEAVAGIISVFRDVETLYEATAEAKSYDSLSPDAREVVARLGFEPAGDDSLYAELSEWASQFSLGYPVLTDDGEVELRIDGANELRVRVDDTGEPVDISLNRDIGDDHFAYELLGDDFQAAEAFLATTGALEYAGAR